MCHNGDNTQASERYPGLYDLTINPEIEPGEYHCEGTGKIHLQNVNVVGLLDVQFHFDTGYHFWKTHEKNSKLCF